jgi:hypothetical protein
VCRPQLGDSKLEASVHHQAVTAGAAQLLDQHIVRVRQVEERLLAIRPHRDHGARHRLAEQPRERVAREAHPAAGAAAQAGLGQRDAEPAVGHVVGGAQHAVRARAPEQRC